MEEKIKPKIKTMKSLKAQLVFGKQNVEDMTRIQNLVYGDGNYHTAGTISVVKRR